MRAAVAKKAKELVIEERGPLVTGPGQVLVNVKACGVCHTDLHVLDGDHPLARFPVVLGHEVAGEVASLGAGVTHLKLGDRVGIPYMFSACGLCRYCSTGREQYCETLNDSCEFTGVGARH